MGSVEAGPYARPSRLSRSAAALAEGAPYALGRERQLAEAEAREAGERVGDGGAHRDEAALPGAFGAEGSRAVGVLHEAALERRRHVLGARDPVIDEVRIQELTALVDHLLEERVAEALEHRARVLRLTLERVDRAADVGDRDVLLHAHRARLFVHADLGA